jgi:hypothetical protein
LVPPGTCVASLPAEPDLCPNEDERDRGLMTSPYTKPPWHMELYINENDRKFPPSIIGIRDNYQVATCCGLDEETDEANGRLIAAAPERATQPSSPCRRITSATDIPRRTSMPCICAELPASKPSSKASPQPPIKDSLDFSDGSP